ncbi:phage baseplate assembly protein V [Shewanella frigidimarina]|uniref:phage baseplate assembly protein V n=1 Tax=Shewanella frigidimarina TaxID=56812 RepID=UPI003D7900AC
MLELLNQQIESSLAPLIEKLAELESQIEDLSRCHRGLIRLGKVAGYSENHQRIKVKYGENETPFIKWFSACAGNVAEYRLPSINEQAILLNFGGGDNSSMTVALIGIPSDEFPLPSNNPDETVRVYPDDTSVRYNHKSHKLTLAMAAGEAEFVVPDKVTFNTAQLHCTGDITSDADISDKTRSMAEDRAIYNGHDHPHGIPNTSAPNQQQ